MHKHILLHQRMEAGMDGIKEAQAQVLSDWLKFELVSE
jgi:hypothetical protein